MEPVRWCLICFESVDKERGVWVHIPGGDPQCGPEYLGETARPAPAGMTGSRPLPRDHSV